MAAASEPAVTLPASCANSVTYSPAVSTPAATSAVSAVAGTVGRVQSERAAAASAEAKSAAHFAEDLALFDWQLDQEDMARLEAINKQPYYEKSVTAPDA